MAGQLLEIGSIERKNLNELAYERLKTALLSGRINPGSLITLRQLATELGTSMMPVREAVGRLAAEQAVEVLPNRGIRIPMLTNNEWNEIWELRIKLEGDAAGYAALEATPKEVTAIRAAYKRVRKAANTGLLHETLESNSEFQFAIFQAAKTRVLIRFVETLRMQIVPHCTAAMHYCLNDQHPFLAHTLINDNELVEAIAARDAKLASETKRRDILELREFVEEVTPR